MASAHDKITEKKILMSASSNHSSSDVCNMVAWHDKITERKVLVYDT